MKRTDLYEVYLYRDKNTMKGEFWLCAGEDIADLVDRVRAKLKHKRKLRIISVRTTSYKGVL